MDSKNKDMQSMMATLMQNAQKMQENLLKAQAEMAEKSKDILVMGKAGGNLVVVQVDLKLQVRKIDLDPQLFTENPVVIAELIAAAVNQGILKAQETMRQEMAEITKKLGMPSDLPFPFNK